MTNYEFIKQETEKEIIIKRIMGMAFPECGMHEWCDYCNYDSNEACEKAVKVWLDMEHKTEEE